MGATEAAVNLDADVLIIGGGPAGAWAAWSAASHGARTVLVDKGYLGTSGATAPGGTNFLYVPPNHEKREQAVEDRLEGGGNLSEAPWIHRLMEQAYLNIELLEQWGYRFPLDGNGNLFKAHLQGPEYMQIMRKVVLKAGVRILDQCPALELLTDEHGVGGARGISRLDGKDWEVRANAVVIATGGCAFLSKGLGCNVQTGDGLLMAAELGADLSGMEFSRQYATTAAFGTITRNRMLGWATFYDEEGHVLHEGGPRESDFMAKQLLKGPVYAILNHADTEEKRRILRLSTPVWFLPFDRAGIDPFTQRFPLTMRFEGTIRGTGGLRLIDYDCSTTVAGLFAAGDAASREKTAGARSGGGAYNASWAIASGTWSGKGAADYALAQGKDARVRQLSPAGAYGLERNAQSTELIDTRAVVEQVQREVFPLDINYFRSEPVLEASLKRLHSLWPAIKGSVPKTIQGRVRARETAAMVATARWMYSAALARKETRGMHGLREYPNLNPALSHRLLLSGIEHITIRPEHVPPRSYDIVSPVVVVKEAARL
ncbi:FAD-binding protein [Paenibacillus sp. YIM B09110]|uniref:FAD-binding protein n=1 Tax=Paenibacillus sp. YIM B09110 TaxID=3126102 RepID=UPI00301E1155